MRRTLYSLAALAVLASGSLPLRTSGAVVALGEQCGNADTCADQGLCVLNFCVTKESLGDTGAINGQNNKCSADDCCPAGGLVCRDILGQTATCLQTGQVEEQLTEVQCRGQPRSFNDTNSANGVDGGVIPDPDNVTDIGKDCDEQTCCVGNLVCLTATRKCAPNVLGVDTIACGSTPPPTTPNTGTASLGQTCSPTTCCTEEYVCYDQSRICGPKVPGLGTLGCGTGATDDTDTDIPPKSCSVNEPCQAGQTCLTNLCVANNLVPSGTNWGLGNTCSADVCCPNGYACLTNAGNRCGPLVTSALGTITCRASGGVSSGQTINGDGNVPAIVPVANNPNQGSTASTIAVGVTHLAVLAGVALVMALIA